MKKIIFFILILAVAAFCLSCGGGSPAETTPDGTPLSTPVETTPEETPVETTPEETPEQTPEATTPKDTPEETPELTTPEDTPENTPEDTVDKGNFEIGEDSDDRIWGEIDPPM